MVIKVVVVKMVIKERMMMIRVVVVVPDAWCKCVWWVDDEAPPGGESTMFTI